MNKKFDMLSHQIDDSTNKIEAYVDEAHYRTVRNFKIVGISVVPTPTPELMRWKGLPGVRSRSQTVLKTNNTVWKNKVNIYQL